MKPTKSKETQACRHWVSVEMEDWSEAWIDSLGLGSDWSNRWKRSGSDRGDGFVGGMGGEIGKMGQCRGWVRARLATGL